MKRILFYIPLGFLFLNCGGTKEVVVEEEPLFQSFQDSVAYYMGVTIAESIKKDPVAYDNYFEKKVFLEGFQEALKDSSAISEKEGRAVMVKFNQKLIELKEAERKKRVETQKEFLAENAKKEGIITTESGLQYEIIQAGTGATPKASDKVEVNYEGKLIDGTVFDSSYERGESITFGVGQVIKGWTEVLQLMKEGAKYRAYIPADLAYGDRDMGEIPPSSTLIFDIELLEIK
ncbi:FKBP-type peptidyl-prolyl cis-trans isomerase [Leeuwenhoekiella marinoflava]|uniref:FKBP-type peptidyl-prolyl cis-trans isomerase n=1 Tax=Leeuwenhoekiella marinoflava TaxID=988 RepID=UPI003001D357